MENIFLHASSRFEELIALAENRVEFAYFVKGLRYELGLGLNQMKALGIPYGNWECYWCGISERNLRKLERMIPEEKRIDELIQVGKTDFEKLRNDGEPTGATLELPC